MKNTENGFKSQINDNKQEELKWYGWKDIEFSDALLGDTIIKGEGIWQKEYTYIKIPCGYGYDNYCFLLSSKLVHCYASKEAAMGAAGYFSVCHDMNIELFYDPEKRETGKKYKRYKMSGYELLEKIFFAYEINFFKQCEEKHKKKVELKEKRDKKNMGFIVCGTYAGNNYSDNDLKYSSETEIKAYFYSGAAYSNSKFEKVQNVKWAFKIERQISKYDFSRVEDVLNAYLWHYTHYYDQKQLTKMFLDKAYERRRNKTWLKIDRKYGVQTNLEDIGTEAVAFFDEAMKKIEEKMLCRLDEMLRA